MSINTARRRPGRSAMRALGACLLAAAVAVVGSTAPAAADSAPVDPGVPTTVAADALPTVQINGVAWSQVVVAGTVYVAGQFSTARPAGAAAGTSTVTRSNLLAYDLATGVLVSSWAPTLDGPAYVIAASPDGARLYVGGEFTKVNGSSQKNFVVLNRSTGARVTGFAPNPNGTVRAIASTSATIYLGGNFNTVGGNDRPRLAALSATSGSVLSWRVSAQSAQVEALVLSPDGSRLIVGGRFEKLNNNAALGSGSVSATTGATMRWDANKLVTNYGFDSGITSLSTDGSLVYGTGFAYLNHAGGYGNLEGTFAADPNTGVVKWVEDCHGDTYSTYANPGKDHIYIAGHPYYCGNIGQFPEASPRFHHYALAFSKQDAMTITPSIHANYYNWAGNRAPDQLAFYPDFTKGTFTGQSQAVWNVTGSGSYVVYGGEFLTINGKNQQGLTRFAMSGNAANDQGPRLTGSALTPVATSRAAGTAQVSWPANWDRDNETLTYQVLRDSSSTPVYSTTGRSRFWQLPRLSFTDTGLVNGRSYSYKVVARDAFGNSVTSPSVNVSVTSSGSLGAYALAVLNANPAGYWRLGETSGSALDWTGYASSTVGSGVTRAVNGALAGDTNKAARFSGTSSGRVFGTKSFIGSNRFSVEAWFRTTSSAGGKIIGFGSSSTGTSGKYDRHVYMSSDGRLTFGVSPNATRAITAPAAYNDGQWHHVVGTLGSTGMALYVDGVLRAQDASTTSASNFTGYWRIGGDAVSGWPGASGQNFAGDIDEVAVYGRALSAGEVAAHRATGVGGSVPVNQAPTASFDVTVSNLTADVDATASADPDGTLAGYAWDFGDGATAAGETASHTYSANGTYDVTLTVTDNEGATGTVQHPVTVSAPVVPTGTLASDAFERTDATGFGGADLGGTWVTTAGAASVANGAGQLTLAGANSSAGARLPEVTGSNFASQVTESWDKRPNASGGWLLLRGRITPGGEYRLKVAHRSGGAVTARIVRTVGGTETAITSETTVSGLTYAAGTRLTVRFEVVGTSPTTLRGKVWAASSAEPAAWVVQATDTTAALQGPGHTGVAALVSSTTTNGPITVRLDDYRVEGLS